MAIHVEQDGALVTARIKGAFTFNLRQEFRKVYEGRPPRTHYCLDLREVTMIDSSALGMLLILREAAGGDDADVVIRNLSPTVRTIFHVARYEELFRIV